MSSPSPSPLFTSLEPLFRPRSVAVVGASATPFKQGNVALKYLLQGGYTGAVYPVNPNGGEIEGLTCYRSISEIPGPVDCVLTVIPAAATIATIRECAEKGVGAAIIGANGFAELNTELGFKRERELTAIARAHGIRIIGPNTNGIWNATDKLSIGYNTSHGDAMTPGPMSIAAHSGALFNSVASCLRRYGVGLSKFIPVGNEADLDMLDFLEYFIEDEATGIIGLVVEGLRDGDRFRALAARAHEEGKPIIALKLGRSEAGAGAALAHSSRLAGSARAYASLFAECGVPMVPSIEAMAGAAALLKDFDPLRMRGDQGLVCVTTSGGGGSLLADHAADRDIPLAAGDDGEWKGEAADVIETFTGAGLIRNPIDGGNLAGWKRLEPLFAGIEANGHMGPVALFAHMLPQETSDRAVADMLIARTQRTGAPLLVAAPGGLRPAVDAYYRDNGAVVFGDLGTCFDSLAALYDAMGFDADELMEPAQGRSSIKSRDVAAIRAQLARADAGDFLSEIDSAHVLRLAGAPMIESTLVATNNDAANVARAAGFPVVLKALAPGVAHKNDAGLVAVGLRDENAVRDAFDDLGAKAAQLAPAGGVQIIVQPMARARAELILGVTYEPPLGHFLVVGLGGVHAELLDSVVLIPVFVGRERMRDVVDESMAGALIARLDKSGDETMLDEVLDALVALRDLVRACGDMIESVDVNPLLLTDDGCIAVDALIVRR